MNNRLISQETGDAMLSAPLSTGLLQRKCACGQHKKGGEECGGCKKNRTAATLQRTANNAKGVNEVPSIVHDVLRSPGQPLDANTRGFMESRFGHDFSKVRVHTDAKATESARAVNALAYTVGYDVVFAGGRYAPGGDEGRRLLAHELTHTIQQSGLGGSAPLTPFGLEIGDRHDPAEREAESVASNITRGGDFGPPPRLDRGAPRLRREPDDKPKKTPKPLIPIPVFDQLDIKPIIPVPGIGGVPSLEDVHKGIDKIGGLKGSGDGDVPCKEFPGFSPGGMAFKGQCCKGVQSDRTCCPPKSIVIDSVGARCCGPDEAVRYNQCIKKDKASPGQSPDQSPGQSPGPSPSPSHQTLPPIDLGVGKLKPSPFFLASTGSLAIDRFAVDQADLSGEQKAAIDRHAKTLQTVLTMDPDATIEVWGHTDAKGSEEHNDALGQQRADAVLAELVTAGAPADKLTAHSAGKSAPVVKTGASEARNRRVEIRFKPSLKMSLKMRGGAP